MVSNNVYNTLWSQLFNWISFLNIYYICATSDGHKSAQRLSKQVKVATSGIRKRVDLYNAKCASSPDMIVDATQLPSQISVEKALDTTSDVYLCLQSSIRVLIVWFSPRASTQHLISLYFIHFLNTQTAVCDNYRINRELYLFYSFYMFFLLLYALHKNLLYMKYDVMLSNYLGIRYRCNNSCYRHFKLDKVKTV